MVLLANYDETEAARKFLYQGSVQKLERTSARALSGHEWCLPLVTAIADQQQILSWIIGPVRPWLDHLDLGVRVGRATVEHTH